MSSKMTHQQIKMIVTNFAAQATRKYDGHAFTAGYLESMVINLIAKLPAKEQERELNFLLTSSVWNMDTK